MIPPVFHLNQGQVVIARPLDPRGQGKIRPLLIISSSDQISLDEPFYAVAITTTFPDPAPDNHVILPWDPQGRARSGLCRRSAAVCDWVVPIDHTMIEKVAGYVPRKTVRQIAWKVDVYGSYEPGLFGSADEVEETEAERGSQETDEDDNQVNPGG